MNMVSNLDSFVVTVKLLTGEVEQCKVVEDHGDYLVVQSMKPSVEQLTFVVLRSEVEYDNTSH